MRALHARERLVDDEHADVSEGIAVGVDLSGLGSDRMVGYRAKRHTRLIDVERRAGYDVADFWEPMHSRKERNLILDPGEFYILASKEAVQVLPNYAAETLRGRRRARRARSAGGALARSAVHPRARSNQSNSSLDGAPPLQVRSSCQNSKLNSPTPEMAPTTPPTELARSSWAPGAWSMLSRPARETRRSRPTIWAMSRSWRGKVMRPELSNGSMSLTRSDLGCLQTS